MLVLIPGCNNNFLTNSVYPRLTAQSNAVLFKNTNIKFYK